MKGGPFLILILPTPRPHRPHTDISRMFMTDFSLFNMTGKKALVTGGAVGVGRACAIALATGGADVAVVDVNDQIGEKTVESLRSLGVKSFFVHCDVSDQSQVQAMVSQVVERFGRLDIAINNAGVGSSGHAVECLPRESWDRVMRVNLDGVWMCAQEQAKQMIRQTPTEGKIINIASIAGVVSLPVADGAYDAAKAGVIHLTKQLALQWGRFNINVNSISPSYVMTPMMSRSSLDSRQRIRDITPMGYLQRPEDLYGPVQFLASSASDYMTGQNLIVDGGHTLGPWPQEAPKRVVAPRVSVEEELVEMKKDMDAMGVSVDETGVVLD